MKGISKFKKFLIVCFIFSLLSNYILILSEFCNAVYASTPRTSIFGNDAQNETEDEKEIEIHGKGENFVETEPEQTGEKKESIFEDLIDVDGKENETSNEQVENENTDSSSNETEDTNIVDNNEVVAPEPDTEDENTEILKPDDGDENSEGTSVMDELTYAEEPEEENSVKNDMVLEENDKNLEENKTMENQLSTESYQIDNIEIYSNLSLSKFIKFDNESGKGVFVETILKIEYSKEQKKIDNMYISLDVPKVNELMPFHVNISNATSWMYNAENGRLDIQVENVEKFSNDVCLEYKLQFVYTEEAYSAEGLIINGVVGIGNIEKQVEREIACYITEIIETTDSFVNYKAEAENSSIYKGYLKANVISNTKNETLYDVVETVEIKDCNFVDIVELEDIGDRLVQENEQEIVFAGSYKKTSVNMENFEKIFGDEGSIEIYTKDRQFVGIISKASVIENDNYVFEYEGNVNELIFRFVNPIRNGKIQIKNQKSILDTNIFTNEQVESFKYIKSNIKGKFVKQINEQEFVLQNVEFNNQISLENTESKMKIALENKDLSTELENEVTINVTLETDEEKYELFKNPTIDIEFPYSVEKVEIKNINLLYKNGLSLDTWNVVTNTAGEKIIRIDLTGTQLEYAPGTLIDGTQLVIYAKVKVNRLTANGISNIKLKYTNEASSRMAYTVAGKEAEVYEINYVSKNGLIKATSIENFNNNYDRILNYNDEVQIGSLDIASEAKKAKVSMTVVNNYEKDINNVEIIGRIPFSGNTDESGNPLNSNIDTHLLNEITVTGLMSKVYYSYEENIEKDSDLWQETVEDFSQVKSYKIVLENGIMHKGERVTFEYNIEIPKDIYYNASTYGIYTVYYNYDGQDLTEKSIVGLASETKEISLEECQTQENAEKVVIGTQVTRGGIVIDKEEVVNEKQILRYKAVATNNSTETLTNVELKGKVINGNLYYLRAFTVVEYDEEVTAYEYSDDGEQEFETVTIEKLEPGESLVLDYQVVVNEFANDTDEVYGEIYLNADGIEEVKVETIKNKIRDAKIDLRVVWSSTENPKGTIGISSKSRFKFSSDVKNISGEKLENIKLVVSLPENLEYDIDSVSFGNENLVKYEEKTPTGKNVTIEIPSLEAGEENKIFLVTAIAELDHDLEKASFSVVSRINYDGQEYISNDYTKEYSQSETKVEYSFTSDLEKESVVQDDEITYTFKMKNTGIITAYGISIYSAIPYGVDVEKVEVVNGDNKIDTQVDRSIYINENLEPGEEIVITEKVKVNEEKYLYNQEYIECSFKVEGSNFNETTTDVIKYKIENVLYDDSKIQVEEAGDDMENSYENTHPEDTEEDNTGDNVEDIPSGDGDDNTNSDNTENNEDNENTNNDNVENDNTDNDNTDDDNVEEAPSTDNSNDENNNTDVKPEENRPTNDKNNNTTNENSNKTQNTIKKYNISGKVWEDKNKNGIYEETDSVLSNMQVTLYTATNGSNKINKKVTSVKTKENGTYNFENVETGYYMVALEYDTEKYNVTQYKISTAKESANSEFITTNLNIDGKSQTYAVSDIIELKDKNITNLDAGIYLKDEFDLSLSKYIASVEIETAKGKETITPGSSENLVKAEIHSKYINGSKVKVNYIIEITNDGDVTGYVSKVADYLPEGFEFDEEQNSGWRLEDGCLYNSSLINTPIESGKTKKLNLVLTKTLTGEDTKTYTNKAEISEYTNKLNMKDSDSVANNKKESEDDYDKVELLVSIKTGYIVFINIAIIIGVIMLIVLIKLKKINLNFFKKRSYR